MNSVGFWELKRGKSKAIIMGERPAPLGKP